MLAIVMAIKTNLAQSVLVPMRRVYYLCDLCPQSAIKLDTICFVKVAQYKWAMMISKFHAPGCNTLVLSNVSSTS